MINDPKVVAAAQLIVRNSGGYTQNSVEVAKAFLCARDELLNITDFHKGNFFNPDIAYGERARKLIGSLEGVE